MIDFISCSYGDKAPKTIAGRFIAIVWPLIGWIIMAIFIGQVTSKLSAGIIDVHIMVYGKKVSLVNRPF